MAKSGPRNPEQVTREVEREGVRYIGTREALIAAGHVCADAAFPGPMTDRHAPRKYRNEATDQSGRKVNIRRHGAHRFEVLCRREHTELEAAEWKRIEAERAAWFAEHEAKRDRERAERQEQESQALRELSMAVDRERYKTADVLKGDVARIADIVPINMLSDYGWRLCDEDRDRLLGLKAALVAAIQAARVVRDGEQERPRLRIVKA